MTQEQIQQAVTLMCLIGRSFPHSTLTPTQDGAGIEGTIRIEGKVYRLTMTEMENVAALPARGDR